MIRQVLTRYGQFLARTTSPLLDLFYPKLCLACSAGLPSDEENICIFCRRKLPLTGFHLLEENPFTERFWGRLPLTSAASLYHFSKGGRVQRLIHQLKYHHRPEIGYQLGMVHGRQLKQSSYFNGVDLILPVPLHPRKRHQRGYNQSDQYAKGLAEAMKVPWSSHILLRKIYTGTQTQRSRLERFDNVSSVFELQQPEKISGNHIMLVDDVITTGATLEACGQAVLQVKDTSLSFATIAFAN